ncbi:MAG: transposase [Acidimicrobiia bacterium]
MQVLAPLAPIGVGSLTSAKLVAEVTDIRRFNSKDAVACHHANASLPVWAGNCERHRRSRTRIRQPEAAIHGIAVTKSRSDDRSRMPRHERQRRSADCLQRRLADVEYRALVEDTRPASATCFPQAA